MPELVGSTAQMASCSDSPAHARAGGRPIKSARIGVNKPHKRAYEAALKAAGMPHPAKTLFVDDRLDKVEAAEQLGLQGLHYTGAPAALAHRLPRPPAVTRPGVLATSA